jgi:OOP family OmpA-OmpF porin
MKKAILRRFLTSVVASLLPCAAATTATAQTLATSGAALNRFEPSETGSDWFANESLDLRGGFRPALGVVGDYAHKPYVLKNPDGSENTAIISRQVYLHLGASFNIVDRLRIGFSLPIAVDQSGETKTVGSQTFAAPSGAGVGDLRIAADLRLVGEYGDAFTAVIGGRVWLPTGDATQYLGDGQVRVGPHLLAAGDLGNFAYAAGIGVIYRANDTPFNGHPTGTEVTFNAGAGVRFAEKALLIGPELQGSTIVSEGGAILHNHTTPLALIVGGHYNAGDVRVGLGAGPGFTEAAGTGDRKAPAQRSRSRRDHRWRRRVSRRTRRADARYGHQRLPAGSGSRRRRRDGPRRRVPRRARRQDRGSEDERLPSSA